MLRIVIAAVCCVGLVGCSGGESTAPQASGNGSAATPTGSTADAAQHPAAKSAHSFLSAACSGDVATATSHLSPLATQQFKLHGRTFSFPPIKEAKFEVNQVHEAPGNEVAVQFALQLSTPSGEKVETEISCFMKLVDQAWRVCGMAYDAGPGQPPVVFNYENLAPQQTGTPPQQMVQDSQPAAATPQTASNPGGTQNR